MKNNPGYSDQVKAPVRRLKSQLPGEQVAGALQAVEQLDEIDTGRAFHRVQLRIERAGAFRKAYQQFSRVAAVLVLPLLVVAVWSLTRHPATITPEFARQEITTPPGMRSQLILPDGTAVWLNSESTIGYQTPFAAGRREVTLSGEAFFEVKSDAKNPFVVNVGKARVKVLGTTFNVKAYADEPDVEVSLLEGKLELSAGDESGNSSGTVLHPGDRAVYEPGKGIVRSSESLEKYAAWRYGNLVFDETPMQEVARSLERWFGVKALITDPRLNSYRFTTTFANQSLPQVIELLELSSPLSIRYESGKFDKTTNTGECGKIYFSYRPKNQGKMKQ